MDSSKTIPHEIGGIRPDALRFGLHGVKSDVLESHPLQSSYKSVEMREEETKRKVLGSTYGSALGLKMDLDRQILSRFQRPPGSIPSSMIGLEAFTGSLDHIGLEDYWNGNITTSFTGVTYIDIDSLDPRDSEVVRPVDMHHGMEVRLGLSKGPVCPTFF